MTDNERIWDERLRIQTAGRDDTNADEHHHPYEPTPYCVLARLADTGLIGKGDRVLDYGCGKGRVGFFLRWRTGADVTGIEYDPRIFDSALQNQKTALPKARAEFALAKAEEFPVPPEANRCYFFNPFSAEILQKTMARILDSWYENPREILLFFYYPAMEYISFLMTVEELDFYDMIDCEDLTEDLDLREQILIFRLPAPEDWE